MEWKKGIQSKKISTTKAEKNIERLDRTPVIIEASSKGLFLKPIILVEDGVAKTTKYSLRKTRKGMLRLE